MTERYRVVFVFIIVFKSGQQNRVANGMLFQSDLPVSGSSAPSLLRLAAQPIEGSPEETGSCCGCVMWFQGDAYLTSSQGDPTIITFFKLCFCCLYQVIPNTVVVSHTHLNQGPTCVKATLCSPLPSA